MLGRRSHQADLYYNGFCNDVLWPLFNYIPLSINSTIMQSKFWDAYVSANQTFADTVFSAWQPGDVIWVHDYHLMLCPQMLRKKLRDVRIGFFLHTPYPTYVRSRDEPARNDHVFLKLSRPLSRCFCRNVCAAAGRKCIACSHSASRSWRRCSRVMCAPSTPTSSDVPRGTGKP